MSKKICVYAIAKNEENFIDEWVSNMSEADYIVVLDTGSTDKTLTKIKNNPNITKFQKKTIKPFRFDKAREESLKLAPEDTDIFVCTDIDDRFEAGWAEKLRSNWTDDTNRCHYMFCAAHNPDGSPRDVFMNDRIHSKGYHWRFPVHEVLEKDDDKPEVVYTADDADIYLHHLRYISEPRQSYLNLLKLSVEENPKESHCRSLLAREYLLRREYDESLKEYLACLEYEDIYTNDRIATLLEVYNRIADINFYLNRYDDAVTYYNKYLTKCNNHREPYLGLAEVYNNMGLYTLAEASVEAAFKYGIRIYDWLERDASWTYKPHDLLAVAYFYLGDIDKAMEHGRIAAQMCSDDIRIVRNFNAILIAKYEGTFMANVVMPN